MSILRKAIEDWNNFVDEVRLAKEAKQYLSWHIKNVEEPSGYGKDVYDWTNKEIVNWYKEAVK